MVQTCCSQHACWTIKEHKTIKSTQKFIGQVLPTPVALRTTTFVCDHAGKKTTRREINGTSPPAAKRIRKASIKVNCTAKFTKYYMSDNSLKVKYTWKHINHNPHEIKDIIKSLLPEKKWINEHVEQHMDWKSIKSLLRMDDENLDQVTTSYYI